MPCDCFDGCNYAAELVCVLRRAILQCVDLSRQSPGQDLLSLLAVLVLIQVWGKCAQGSVQVDLFFVAEDVIADLTFLASGDDFDDMLHDGFVVDREGSFVPESFSKFHELEGRIACNRLLMT